MAVAVTEVVEEAAAAMVVDMVVAVAAVATLRATIPLETTTGDLRRPAETTRIDEEDMAAEIATHPDETRAVTNPDGTIIDAMIDLLDETMTETGARLDAPSETGTMTGRTGRLLPTWMVEPSRYQIIGGDSLYRAHAFNSY